MKVKQLIKRLQKLDPDALVVLSSDAEGNNYSVLENVLGGDELFSGETGEFYDDSERGKPKDARLAIVLYPG